MKKDDGFQSPTFPVFPLSRKETVGTCLKGTVDKLISQMRATLKVSTDSARENKNIEL
jgi:hypothetical protein